MDQNSRPPMFPNLLRGRERHKLQHRDLAGIRNLSHENTLTLLKSIAKVDSDPLQCLALGLVHTECPSEYEWYLTKVSNTSSSIMLTYLCPICFDIPSSAIDSKFFPNTKALGAVRKPDQGPPCAASFDSPKVLVFWFIAACEK